LKRERVLLREKENEGGWFGPIRKKTIGFGEVEREGDTQMTRLWCGGIWVGSDSNRAADVERKEANGSGI
jgi:hypothetical protein